MNESTAITKSTKKDKKSHKKHHKKCHKKHKEIVDDNSDDYHADLINFDSKNQKGNESTQTISENLERVTLSRLSKKEK
jgi:hypothetical protein